LTDTQRQVLYNEVLRPVFAESMPGSAYTDIPGTFNITQNEALATAKERGRNTETMGSKTQTRFNVIQPDHLYLFIVKCHWNI
jgi:hypothetical protein